MKKSITGEVTKSGRNSGFSLVEVLVSMVIVCLFLGIVSSTVPGFHRVIGHYLDQSMMEEEYLVFLLVFERDYNQAEVITRASLNALDALIFQHDSNDDGDYLDSGESVQYRWNAAKGRIDRKSGKGYYQAFLDGIISFSWERIENTPICHQLMVTSIFSNHQKTMKFCRSNLSNNG